MDYKTKKQEILNRLERLYDGVSYLGNQNLMSRLSDFKEEINEDLQFNVLCIGEFSAGKSTLINRFFIKKDILPAAATETTAKLTFVKYGENEKAVVHYLDGRKRVIENIDEKTIKDFLSKDGKDVDSIDYVEIFINSHILKEGIAIVDSPGLNAPESERVGLTYDFVPRADAVLYVVSALQPWKATEKDFIENKIFRKSDLDKIFFLINFWDAIDEEEKKDILEYVESEMEKSLKVVSKEFGYDIPKPHIIPVSAKTGYNFDELDRLLTDYLSSKKAVDILNQKEAKLEHIKRDVIRYIERQIQNYKVDRSSLEKELDNIKKQLSELEKWKEEYRKNLEPEVDKKLEAFVETLISHCINYVDVIKKKIEDIKVDNVEKFEASVRKLVTKETDRLDEDVKKAYEDFYTSIENLIKEERLRLNLEGYYIRKEFDTKALKKTILDILYEQVEELKEEAPKDQGFVSRIFFHLVNRRRVLSTIQKGKDNLIKEIENSISNTINAFKDKKGKILDIILNNIELEMEQIYRAKEINLESILNSQSVKDKEIERLSKIMEHIKGI